MPPAIRLLLTALPEPLERILTDRLEHRVARLAADVFRAQQALLD